MLAARQPLQLLTLSATLSKRHCHRVLATFQERKQAHKLIRNTTKSTASLARHSIDCKPFSNQPPCGCPLSFWPCSQASTYLKPSANHPTASYFPKSPVSLCAPAKRPALVVATLSLNYNAWVAMHGACMKWTSCAAPTPAPTTMTKTFNGPVRLLCLRSSSWAVRTFRAKATIRPRTRMC